MLCAALFPNFLDSLLYKLGSSNGHRAFLLSNTLKDSCMVNSITHPPPPQKKKSRYFIQTLDVTGLDSSEAQLKELSASAYWFSEHATHGQQQVPFAHS